jgi:tRNA-(ms[2]io[6]A)-hydroxylase
MTVAADTAIAKVKSFICTPTPQAWLNEVHNHIPELLIDHANCEKKAASTALSMMYRYVEHIDILHKMSKLAREELRHFEQVLDLMEAQGITYRQLSSARYAQGLHAQISKQEPYRLIDHLICGAVVEARSCERFASLIDVLPPAIGNLYRKLLNSEARHFQDYLHLAQNVNSRTEANVDVAARVEVFLEIDREMITGVDKHFRFHSGVPN